MLKKLFFTLFLILPATANAAPSPFLKQDFLKNHKYTIERIEHYLSNINTIISDFTQIAPDGSLATGKFYMQRPGKMRWQYNPPTPILIVSSGSQIVFYDYELEQVSYLPLDGSLIDFLAQERIRFDGDVGITQFSNKDAAIRVEVAQKDKPDEGRLMLEFSDKPLALRSMVITDATGQVTTVALNNAKYGAKIENKLFVFKDPRQRIK